MSIGDGKLFQQLDKRASAWHEVSHAPRDHCRLVQISSWCNAGRAEPDGLGSTDSALPDTRTYEQDTLATPIHLSVARHSLRYPVLDQHSRRYPFVCLFAACNIRTRAIAA